MQTHARAPFAAIVAKHCLCCRQVLAASYPFPSKHPDPVLRKELELANLNREMRNSDSRGQT